MYDRTRLDLWLAGLRSGRFPKGRGWLHVRKDEYGNVVGGGEEGFCCIGVLCEVAIENGAVIPRTPNTGTVAYGIDKRDTEAPIEAVEWLGFRVDLFDGLGILPDEIEWNSLAQANDYYPDLGFADNPEIAELTFAQIADLIEANYTFWLPREEG